MKTTRKVVALMLVCVMFVTLAACGQSSSGGNNAGGNTTGGTTAGGNTAGENSSGAANASGRDSLSIAVTLDRGTLDPRNMQGSDMNYATPMLYETLWDWKPNGDPVWKLATGVDFVEPTRWIVHVREGVTFANGSALTASDIIWSIEQWNHRTGETPLMSLFDYENSRVIDDYTAELIFTEANAVYKYTLSTIYIFDQDTFDPDTISQETNGTGPYEITEYVVNSHMFLSLRDGYWGETPAIKNLEFRVLAESTQRVNALQVGSVDISAIQPQDVEFVRSFPDYNIAPRTSQSVRSLFFNIVEGTLFHDNTDARIAMSYAIDREGIIQIAYNGLAELARMPGATINTDVEQRYLDYGIYGLGQGSYNPELAREYAEKAGLIGKEIRLITNPSADCVVIAEIVQQNMRDIGVDLSIRQIDQAAWVQAFFDPYTADWDVGVDFCGTPNLLIARAYEDTLNRWLGGAYATEPWPGRDRAMELKSGIMALTEAEDRTDRVYELNQIITDACLWFGICEQQTFIAYNAGLPDIEIARNRWGSIIYSDLYWK